MVYFFSEISYTSLRETMITWRYCVWLTNKSLRNQNNANIVEVIGDVISLQKAGRNYLGLCPFHGEKTPSFNVVEDKQFYHCFGCGRSGDVFKFIEEYQGVPFMEAVQILGQRVGIEVENRL